MTVGLETDMTKSPESIMSLDDLVHDPSNARAHTQRGIDMISVALGEVGAARSIVIDETGTVLAGNATVEAAAIAGINRVKVVEADGKTIVAVRRIGLTHDQKKRLALFDNRAAELSGWEPSSLARLELDGLSLDALWSPIELAEVLADWNSRTQEVLGEEDIGKRSVGAASTWVAMTTRNPTDRKCLIGDVEIWIDGDVYDAWITGIESWVADGGQGQIKEIRAWLEQVLQSWMRPQE
jgi:hypothetical protein